MSRRRAPQRWAAVSLALMAAGCVPTLPQGAARAPNTEVPDAFGGALDTSNSGLVDWHDFFEDPQLVALIEVALENNQELNILVQEMLVTESEIMARRGEYLPRLGIGGGAGIERVGTHSSQGASDEQAGLRSDLQDYQVGLFASWEVDIWRRLRNLRDAAVHRYLASVEGRNFMVTRLVAEIANLYYELLALDAQQEVIVNSIALQESALEVVRLQQQSARVTMLAVNRFEAQLRGFQAVQYEIAQAIVERENRLNFLMGRFPQPVPRSSASFLTREPMVVSAGLPTQLLENRPDVRQAELQLEAASLDVRAARARFYPALRLEAAVGLRSYNIRNLISPGSIVYNLFSNILAPLFNRNDITAQYYASNARQMQAVLVYEQAILGAFVEVMTSLSRINNLRGMYELKEQQVARLTESIEISNSLFNNARADYLEVLTTRRDALEAQIELIEIRRLQLSASVEVYRALGGGWRPAGDGAEASPQEAPAESDPGSTEEPARSSAGGEE
jgi:NodT family efflux transporter outer membrane factor (OMF) lipoprotein